MLRRSLLGSDVAGRLGGDEFAVVLHNIGTPHNAEAVARRILQHTEEPIMLGEVSVQVRGSIGIAVCGPDKMSIDELMNRADVAMYQAKRKGTNGWQHYEPSITDVSSNAVAVPSVSQS